MQAKFKTANRIYMTKETIWKREVDMSREKINSAFPAGEIMCHWKEETAFISNYLNNHTMI